jgi:hypothetical protein
MAKYHRAQRSSLRPEEKLSLRFVKFRALSILSNMTFQTYTVDWDRTGPKLGHVVGRLIDGGQRFIANHGNELTLSMLANAELEPIGMKGLVDVGPDGRNLFTISPSAKL